MTTVSGIDPDSGTTLIFSISGGADQAKFQIASATGVLSLLSAPDYENPTDAGGDNGYEVTVRASDGILYDEQTITVTVTDVFENTGPSNLVASVLTVAENEAIGTVVGEVNATDPDAGATLSYSLVSGVGDGNNSLFTLETNGTLKTANASTYAIRVEAKDDYNATVEGNFDYESNASTYASDEDNTGWKPRTTTTPPWKEELQTEISHTERRNHFS